MEYNDVPMMTKDRFAILRKLSLRPLTSIDLDTDRNLDIVQDLVRFGYARDYGNQHGRRVPIRLRIWGITSAGKAVLEQQALTENKGPQLSLSMKKE